MNELRDALMNDAALESALLRSASTDTAPAGSRDEMLARLGLGVVAGGAAAAAGAAVGKGTSVASAAGAVGAKVAVATTAVVTPLAKIGIVVSVVALGAVGTAAVVARSTAPRVIRPTAAQPVVSTATARVDLPANAPPTPIPVVTVDDLPVAARELHPVSSVEARVITKAEEPAPNAAAPDSLGREVALVASARESLARGDTTQARAVLAEYRAQFADSALTAEAAALEVEAARLDHDWARVRSLGDAYLRRFPETPHAARVRRWINEAHTNE
jgi:hypothetical protein